MTIYKIKILLVALLLSVPLATSANAKSLRGLAQDAELYDEYVHIQEVIFEEFGGKQACRMAPIENHKKSDPSNPLYEGECILPGGTEYCLTHSGQSYCFDGGIQNVRLYSTKIRFLKNNTSADVRWQMDVFDRCPVIGEWIQVLHFRLDKADDGAWTTTSRKAGLVVDLRNQCTKWLKKQASADRE